MYVLGLRGKRGAGKDFLTKNVLSPYYGAKPYAFADELKRQVKESYGLTDLHMSDLKLKEAPLLEYPVNPKDELAKVICSFFSSNKAFPTIDGKEYWSPRLMLIAEAQYKRAIDPDYWANFIFRKITSEGPEFAVITDVRFPETEGMMIKEKLNGKVIDIKRPLEMRGLQAELNDPSETAMDNWPHYDAVVSNIGDASNLRLQSHNMFRKWGWSGFSWLLKDSHNEYLGAP